MRLAVGLAVVPETRTTGRRRAHAVFFLEGSSQNPRGVEQIAHSSGNREVGIQDGAFSGASIGDLAVSDRDLALVVNRWPNLPDSVRVEIVAMVMAGV